MKKIISVLLVMALLMTSAVCSAVANSTIASIVVLDNAVTIKGKTTPNTRLNIVVFRKNGSLDNVQDILTVDQGKSDGSGDYEFTFDIPDTFLAFGDSSTEGEYTVSIHITGGEALTRDFEYLTPESALDMLINGATDTDKYLSIVNPSSASTTYLEITSELKKQFICRVIEQNRTFSNAEEFEAVYELANVLYAIYTARYSNIESLLGANKELLGLNDNTDYQTYTAMDGTKKQATAEKLLLLLDETPAYTVASLNAVFNTAVRYGVNYVPATTDNRVNTRDDELYIPGSEVNPPSDDEGETEPMAFTDLDGYTWAKTAITALVARSIISGNGDGTFGPDKSITREEFVKMIVLSLKLEGSGDGARFTDVAQGAWYESYVSAAVNSGIISGEDTNTFGIGKSITRQDAAVIISRALGLEQTDADLAFDDVAEISDYALDGVSATVNAKIMSGVGDNTFAPSEQCTRAMASVIIYNAINYIEVNDDTFYAMDEPYANKVKLLSSLGIINDVSKASGLGDSRVIKQFFYRAICSIISACEATDSQIINILKNYGIDLSENDLSNSVTRRDALGIALCVLGYSNTILSDEGITKGAGKLGILKYVAGDLNGDITLSEVVELLNAIIDTDMELYSLSATDEYSNSNDVKPLEYYRDIYKLKATVSKVDYASPRSDLSMSTVTIDGDTYYVGDSDVASYYSLPVIAYVHIPKDSSGTVLYATINEQLLDSYSVASYDIISVEEDFSEFSFYKNDKKKTICIDRNVRVVYNGIVDDTYTTKDFMPSDGMVDLYDRDRDGKYDVVNITSYQTVIVDYISPITNKLFSKLSNQEGIVIDGNATHVFVEKNNARSDLSSMTATDVALIAQSKDKALTRILVSNDTMKGKISVVDDDYISVDGIEVRTSGSLSDAEVNGVRLLDNYSTTDDYTVYLDALGSVCYFEKSSAYNYLFATKLTSDEDTESYYLRAMELTGTWNTYELADRVILNTDTIDAEDFYAGYRLNFEPQLLRVYYDSAGRVKRLIQAVEYTTYDESVFTKYTVKNLPYASDNMCLGTDLYLTADTKVIIVPTDDMTNEKKYRLYGASYFEKDRWYSPTAYEMNKYHVAPIVVFGSKVEKYEGAYLVMKKTTELIDAEAFDKILCMDTHGQEVEFYGEETDTLRDVKVGDLISAATNTLGQITGYSTPAANGNASLGKDFKCLYTTRDADVYGDSIWTSGVVTDLSAADRMLLVDFGLGTTSAVKLRTDTTCILYDGANKLGDKIQKVSVEEICPDDKVYIKFQWSKAETIYIIRNIEN